MNTYYTIAVKYSKQQENSTFKKVAENYLLSGASFGDVETQIHSEVGEYVKGDFKITGIKPGDFQEIFYNEKGEVWYKCKIKYESDAENESGKGKKVTQQFLVQANSVKEAYEIITDKLRGMMMDYGIPTITESGIVEVLMEEKSSSSNMPKLEDYYDTSDPRGPSRSEYEAYEEVILKYKEVNNS